MRTVAVLSVLLLAACSPTPRATPTTPPTSTPDPKPRVLNVGVATDQPGLGTFNPSTHDKAGFDVDLYRWLGDTAPKFEPVAVPVAIKDRVDAVRDRKVNIVVETFSITDERRKTISFAGPYLKTQQGVLVRTGDDRVRTFADLVGKVVCVQEGSTSKEQLKSAQQGVTLVEATGSQECVDKLLAKQVDAFSTDQLILAGFAKHDREKRLTVVPNLNFGALERYGVGLPKGDVKLCQELTEKIKTLITSGHWDIFFRNNFGDLDLKPEEYKPDPNVLNRCE